MRRWLFPSCGILFLILLGVPGVTQARQAFVDICHYNESTGDWTNVQVPGPAADAHLQNHPDGIAGGDDFYPDCVPREIAAGSFWEDSDADGVRESGEPAIAGLGVELWDLTDEPVLVASRVIGVAGEYQFDEIEAGRSYGVCWIYNEQPPPPSHQFVGQTAPTLDDPRYFDCYPPSVHFGYRFDVSRGDRILDLDFGFIFAVSTSGYIWEDRIPDGQWDRANEWPLVAWTVELLDVTSGTPTFLATANTNGSGYYEFSLLYPRRDYAVCELISFSHEQTYPTLGTTQPNVEIYNCSLLGIQWAPYGYVFTAESGEAYGNNNFGNVDTYEPLTASTHP